MSLKFDLLDADGVRLRHENQIFSYPAMGAAAEEFRRRAISSFDIGCWTFGVFFQVARS
jgi:hypothetical protein